MDSAKLRDWMELIGILAVVASLVFVGLQLQQSQEIAIANQYQERAALSAQYRDAVIQSEVALTVSGTLAVEQLAATEGWTELRAIVEAAPPEYFGFLRASLMRALVTFDNNYFQYRAGFLTETAWQSIRSSFKANIDNDTWRYIWETSRQDYNVEFQQEVDRLFEEIDNLE